MSSSKKHLAIMLSVGMVAATLIYPQIKDVMLAEQRAEINTAASVATETSANRRTEHDPAQSTHVSTDALYLSKQAQNLDPKVISLGLIAYNNAAKQGITQKKLLTIVDYSKPSTERRLWVFDLEKKTLLFNELVAHGKQSGENQAISFSNKHQSNKSSIGVYVTQETYSGKHGYSLRLDGLEKGFNDNAAARAIVVHSADYVSNAIANTKGRLGRSLGCLALSPETNKPVIDTIKEGTVIFAYYPDEKWIQGSKFLST